MRHIRLACIIVLMLVMFVTPARSRDFTEGRLLCRSLQVGRDDAGVPHALVACQTFDTAGEALRTFNVDIFPSLTPSEKQCLSGIENKTLQVVGARESIPTSTQTVTPRPASTPAL